MDSEPVNINGTEVVQRLGGNTSPPTSVPPRADARAPRYRRWCMTIFDEKFDFSTIEKVSYGLAGKETCPTTGKLHYQCYFEFDGPVGFNWVKKQFGNAHIEHAMGGPEANITYCSKDGEKVFEVGTPAKERMGKRNDLLVICHNLKGGGSMKDVINDYPDTFVRNYRGLNVLKSILEEKRNWVTEVHYYYGASGTGKTRAAVEDGATIIEFRNGFINGYDGEDIVLFDDVDRTTFLNYRSILLQICDRYAMNVNTKGSFRNWKPRKIYFTSNYDPRSVFEDAYDAMIRRLTEVKHFQ